MKYTARSIVVFLLMLAVFPFSVIPAAANEKLALWDLLNGGDGIHFRALVKKFNEEHKGKIEVTQTSLAWGTPYYTKLQASVAIGKGPDVAIYHASRLQYGVSARILAPIDIQNLESAGLRDADFPANAIEAATIDGKRYAVPFDVHGTVLYYNKTILKQIGLLGADDMPLNIDTLDGWHGALTKAQAAGKTGVVFDSNEGDIRLIYTLFGELGGELLNEGKFLQGDDFDRMSNSINEVGSWIKNGWAPAYLDYTSAVAAFAGNQSAFMINGGWEVSTMEAEKQKNNGFDYGIIPVPAWLGKPAAWSDSHVFVLPANAGATMSPERRDAALEFIAWMAAHSIEWAEAGNIPAYLPVRQSPEFKALKPQSNFSSFVDSAFYMPKSKFTGAASPFEENWGSTVSNAVNGDGDSRQALERFRDTMNAL